MNTYRRWFFNIFAGLGIVLAVAAWAVFAPVKMGGHSNYIIINGNSMEPGIHKGDLIVVQPEKQYQIGDAVAYWNAQMGRYVFHRIVGIDLDRYVFKGDNNHWTDAYKPTASELVGRQWIQIPKFGTIIEWIRQPLVIALIIGGFGGLLMASFFADAKKKQSGKKNSSKDFLTAAKEWFIRSEQRSPQKNLSIPDKKPNSNLPKQGWNARDLNSTIEISFFALGLIGLAGLILGAFAFFNPLTRTETRNFPYTQQGVFTYQASAPAGVYDSQAVNTGDPIFTKLTCKIDLGYQYLVNGTDLSEVAGSHQLTAVLSEPTSGWTRTIPLETKQNFVGNQFSSQAVVDFCQMQSIAAAMEEQTGMTSYSYTVSINPGVQVMGVVNNAVLSDSFVTPLTFQLDKVHAFVTKPSADTNPLNPVQEGMLSQQVTVSNTLSILGLEIPVQTARNVALIALGISLIGLLVLTALISRTSKRSKEMLVRMKYGSTLVDVAPQTPVFNRPAVDVQDIDDLARLAERSNTVILHKAEGWMHTYLVEGDQITYRYILSDNGNHPVSTDAFGNNQPFDLRQAIEREELKVYYQPIVSLTDGKITAVEALLRWQHPQNGLISAKDFITAAESSGLIDSIGEWVLQTACTQIKIWRESGNPLRLAVNFSQRQIEKHPAQMINQVLRRTGLSADALQIEIPESSLSSGSPSILSNIQELRQIGVKVSLDGYSGRSSSMSIGDLPVDSIKIDRREIEKVTQPRDAEYVQGIISAALNRGLNVVAEGVETQDQMDFLRLQLCSQAQGFLIARPAPAEEISALLVNA